MAIAVEGYGVVSPAGWGVPVFLTALASGQPTAEKFLPRPGSSRQIPIKPVPAPLTRPSFLGHARLRRASPISHYALGAALEAVAMAQLDPASCRLGIIFCSMSGCVNYSRRFYDEALRDPSTASPLVFPETVYNAPASHISCYLGSCCVNYTLVGDPGTFLQGLALAAEWLEEKQVEAVLVISSEETDWLTANAFRLFERKIVLSDGASAFLLRETETPELELVQVTESHLYTRQQSRLLAARKMREQLNGWKSPAVLSDGCQNLPRLDSVEQTIWADWKEQRISVKKILGEGLMSGGGWQCVAALDKLKKGQAHEAVVSVVGCNQQAIGARFKIHSS